MVSDSKSDIGSRQPTQPFWRERPRETHATDWSIPEERPKCCFQGRAERSPPAVSGAERWLGVRAFVNNPGGPAHTGRVAVSSPAAPEFSLGTWSSVSSKSRRLSAASQPGVCSDAMFLCKIINVTDSYRNKLRAALARPLQILTPFFWVLQHRQRLQLCGQI